MEELIRKVEKWAKDKGILKPNNSQKQLLKTMEELGEVSRALLKENEPELIDGIGDVTVTLIIFARQNGLDFQECLQSAYDEIKNRTGEVKDGIFVKDNAMNGYKICHVCNGIGVRDNTQSETTVSVYGRLCPNCAGTGVVPAK